MYCGQGYRELILPSNGLASRGMRIVSRNASCLTRGIAHIERKGSLGTIISFQTILIGLGFHHYLATCLRFRFSALCCVVLWPSSFSGMSEYTPSCLASTCGFQPHRHHITSRHPPLKMQCTSCYRLTTTLQQCQFVMTGEVPSQSPFEAASIKNFATLFTLTFGMIPTPSAELE